jgi:Reverse transcriptase (RNA-dependent DNA polymerase)
LLSCLGKIFERVISNRIVHFISIHNILPDEQFGFRSGHSTIHQVCRIKNLICTNKSQRRSTGMVLLDVEKAFDSIWHNGLLYKMHLFNFPDYILKLIKSFCSNRSFQVCVGGSLSSAKLIPAGVPQGSILSPFLYSIYTADIKRPRDTNIALYADDTALITTGKLTKAIIRRLNSAIKSVNKFYKKWKINLNLDKSQAIIFPFNKSPKRKPISNIVVDDSTIKFSKEVTYLGITLDSKLTFASHIKTTCVKASNCLKSLFPLLNRKSRLSLKNKNLLFKSIIRPILSYGAPIWKHSAWTHRKKLQIIQNKTLKIINNLPWRFSTAELHNLTNYQLLDNFIDSLSTKFFDGCAHSPFEIIRNIK